MVLCFHPSHAILLFLFARLFDKANNTTVIITGVGLALMSIVRAASGVLKDRADDGGIRRPSKLLWRLRQLVQNPPSSVLQRHNFRVHRDTDHLVVVVCGLWVAVEEFLGRIRATPEVPSPI
jgi:hypothetical protein